MWKYQGKKGYRGGGGRELVNWMAPKKKREMKRISARKQEGPEKETLADWCRHWSSGLLQFITSEGKKEKEDAG